MTGELKRRIGWLVALIAAIWLVQGLNLISGYALNGWLGLDPRDLTGLIGIPAMPFLHGSVSHAVSNTVPLIVLGSLLSVVTRGQVMPVNLVIVLLGGALVWLLARDAIHVGASGLLFGWFGFLLTRGVLDRSLLASGIAMFVAVFYGAMIWGVLPRDPSVSWESHLLGAIAGIAAAVLLPARVAVEKR